MKLFIPFLIWEELRRILVKTIISLCSHSLFKMFSQLVQSSCSRSTKHMWLWTQTVALMVHDLVCPWQVASLPVKWGQDCPAALAFKWPCLPCSGLHCSVPLFCCLRGFLLISLLLSETGLIFHYLVFCGQVVTYILMTYFNQRPSTTLGAAVSPPRKHQQLGWGSLHFLFPSSVFTACLKALLSHGVLTQVGMCDTVFLSASNSSPKMDWNPVNAWWYQRSFLWVFSCLTLLRSKQEVLQNCINILIDAIKTSISECLFTSVLPLFYPFWLDNFWLDHSFQRVLFQPAWMSIITEFVIFKDLGTFLGGGLGVGGLGSPGRGPLCGSWWRREETSCSC